MTMRSPVRLAVLSVTVLMSGCAWSGSGDGSADDPIEPTAARGCGECVEEIADVRVEIEGLPDVTEVLTLATYGDTPTNGAGVQVELRTSSDGDPYVVDEVARIIWQSPLAPVDEVFVVVEDGSGELVRGSSPFDFADTGRHYATYVARWGPRSVEG